MSFAYMYMFACFMAARPGTDINIHWSGTGLINYGTMKFQAAVKNKMRKLLRT